MPELDTSPKRTMDVFTQGYAKLRSRAYPYLVDQLGPLWYFHDALRKDPRKERSREIVALATTRPATVMKRIKAAEVGRHTLCVYHESMERDLALESTYKDLGYRCQRHESVFVYPLPPAPRNRLSHPVKRVADVETARRVAETARSRQIDEKDLGSDDADRRLFASIDGDRVRGYCSSIRVDETAAWVANVHVMPEYRGQRIGTSLMRAMLKDDAGRGIRQSFLTATGLGAKLYRSVGYRQLGVLQIFSKAGH